MVHTLIRREGGFRAGQDVFIFEILLCGPAELCAKFQFVVIEQNSSIIQQTMFLKRLVDCNICCTPRDLCEERHVLGRIGLLQTRAFCSA